MYLQYWLWRGLLQKDEPHQCIFVQPCICPIWSWDVSLLAWFIISIMNSFNDQLRSWLILPPMPIYSWIWIMPLISWCTTNWRRSAPLWVSLSSSNYHSEYFVSTLHIFLGLTMKLDLLIILPSSLFHLVAITTLVRDCRSNMRVLFFIGTKVLSNKVH